jgi:hypothetical protein
MILPTRFLGRGIFAAALLGALGFGATQAVASPTTPAAARAICSRDEGAACNGACVDEYGWGYRGRCSKDYFGFITCECFSISGTTS